MATTKEAEVVKAMKEATTGQEMVESWAKFFPGGDEEIVKEVIKQNKNIFRVYIEKAPHMLETFPQKPLAEVVERGILDPKTRELILVGMLAVMGRTGGLIFHILAAVCHGATEEEIMEIIFLAAYEQAKCQMGTMGEPVAEALRLAAKIKPR
jgi:alkylhydroperoxidase/carboxymuconolactone decarboxylase family protein YurZ